MNARVSYRCNCGFGHEQTVMVQVKLLESMARAALRVSWRSLFFGLLLGLIVGGATMYGMTARERGDVVQPRCVTGSDTPADEMSKRPSWLDNPPGPHFLPPKSFDPR